jgi:hypothetical protein
MSQSSTNNRIMRINMPVSGSVGTLTLNSLVVNYTGASDADIAAAGVKLWTGNATATTTQIGTSQSLSGGVATFSGLTTVLGSGNNYFWITLNASASAVFNNSVDVKIVADDIIISETAGADAAGSQPVADLDPAGDRKIDYCLGTYSNTVTTDIMTALSIPNTTFRRYVN